MQISRFISKRLSDRDTGSFSSTVHRIATWSVTLGLAVLISSFSILHGFQHEIERKVFSFGAHIQVSKFDLNNSFEDVPISLHTDLYEGRSNILGIDHIQSYARKIALLKKDDDVWSVLFKGVGMDYDIERFNQNMVQGQFLSLTDTAISQELVLSTRVADKLRLGVGDQVLVCFVQDPPRYRKLTVTGLYSTGMEEFDESIALADLKLVQQLNDWGPSDVGGYEIFINDFKKLDEVTEQVYALSDFDLRVEKVTDTFIQLFDWLRMMDQNVYILLGLILIVAIFNILSSLIILIMERTRMIGTLKALGGSDWQIRKVFLLKGMGIVLWGIVWGNVIGISFCLIQKYTGIIPLDPVNYYMDAVPIYINWWVVLALNLTMLTMVNLSLLVPTMMITRMQPIDSIRFD